MSLFNAAIEEEKTRKAIKNLKVGYRFSEMCHFWVDILYIKGDMVAYIETNPDYKSGWKLTISTIEEFKERFAYSHKKDYYWIGFHGLNKEVQQNAKDILLKFLRAEEQKVSKVIKSLLEAEV